MSCAINALELKLDGSSFSQVSVVTFRSHCFIVDTGILNLFDKYTDVELCSRLYWMTSCFNVSGY